MSIALAVAFLRLDNMKIELKNLKIARHLSQETEAFSAKISVDGIIVGDVRNSGQGGCHEIYIAKEFGDVVSMEASRLFPPKEKYDDPMEDLINDLLEKEEDRKTSIKLRKAGWNHVVKIYANKETIGGRDFFSKIIVVGYEHPDQLNGLLDTNRAEKHEVLA